MDPQMASNSFVDVISGDLYSELPGKLREGTHPGVRRFIAAHLRVALVWVALLQQSIKNILNCPEIHGEREILKQVCRILKFPQRGKRRVGGKPGPSVVGLRVGSGVMPDSVPGTNAWLVGTGVEPAGRR